MRVPRSQRGGEVIEPLVRDQWFVRMQPLAEPALKVQNLLTFEALLWVISGLIKKGGCTPEAVATGEHWVIALSSWTVRQWNWLQRVIFLCHMQAVADGDIKIVPDRFEKVYNRWLENIRDWCISRQLWWGHRIPVWYCFQDESSASSSNGTCSDYVVARNEAEAITKAKQEWG